MTTPEIRSIAVKALVLSDTQAQEERRGRFDKVALQELAKSLTTTGQINPIVVRPVGKAFEIVAGERRYLAAKIAQLTEILCSVRDLSDQQVLEVQLIENLQREDLHELAEAEAYEALVKMGRTPAQIAGMAHKDESYVRKRMRLLSLGKKGRKAFYDGRVTVAIAIILARIPVEKLQDEALEWYLDASQYDQLTAEEFRDQVQRDYMTDLATAPFDITDPKLVPGATACAVCPKNTLCQQQLFNDIKDKKAHCTDSVCFQAKRVAHGQIQLEKAKKTGREVITGKEAKRIAEHGRSHLVGYVDVAGHAHGQPVKKLLKGVDPAKLKLLQLPSGEVIEVAPVSLVNKAKPESSSTPDYNAQNRANEKKRRFELDYRAQLFKTIYVEGKGSSDTEDLRLACEAMFDRLHHDGVVRFFKVMGLEPVEKKDQYRGKVKRYEWSIVAGQAKDVAGLWRLLRALSVAGDLEVYSHSTVTRTDRLHKLAERVGVKASKLYDTLKAEAAAKAKPKAKKKAGKK